MHPAWWLILGALAYPAGLAIGRFLTTGSIIPT
jgi:hypothetical protein